jgi:carbamoyltransferase
MKDRLNRRIKRRESFRPFAPSVLKEKAGLYFKMPRMHDSPYMILAGEALPEMRDRIPAVIHADGTARVHTVEQTINPQFYRLILEFEKLTGLPLLLNTSFNENEPIVCTPQEAIECYLRTELDVLVMGDYWMEKPLNHGSR